MIQFLLFVFKSDHVPHFRLPNPCSIIWKKKMSSGKGYLYNSNQYR